MPKFWRKCWLAFLGLHVLILTAINFYSWIYRPSMLQTSKTACFWGNKIEKRPRNVLTISWQSQFLASGLPFQISCTLTSGSPPDLPHRRSGHKSRQITVLIYSLPLYITPCQIWKPRNLQPKISLQNIPFYLKNCRRIDKSLRVISGLHRNSSLIFFFVQK